MKNPTMPSPNPGPPAGMSSTLFRSSPSHPAKTGGSFSKPVSRPLPQTRLRLPEKEEIEIGHVQPFGVNALNAESNRTDGRRLQLHLNKSLPEGMTAEEFAPWFTLTPAVPNLKVTLQGIFLTFSGDFALSVPYRLTLKRGLPAREPVTLAAPYTGEAIFERIAPRLYFQDFAAHQWTSGTRQLRLLAVNVPRVRVSAKLFTGDSVPVAHKAFEKYQQQPHDEPDEYYSRVNVEELAGTAIWEKEISSAGTIDDETNVVLDWNEIVGANKSGAVLLTAESLDPMPPGGKRVGAQTLIQLTDLGAVWKRDRDSIFLHLFSLASGQSVPSLRVQLLDDESAVLAEGTTDATGNLSLPEHDTARWIFARGEQDSHLISFYGGENYLPPYRLGVTAESEDDGAGANTIFLFTERGVYKPGDKLFLKGYARDPRADQASIPAGKVITLTLTDPKEREILTEEITLSDFGAFAHEITLPEGTLGKYRLTAAGQEGDRLGGIHYFQVQEYKPNAFEIIIPEPPESFGDTQLALPITAKYFMGKPLAKAPSHLVARGARYGVRARGPFQLRLQQRHLRSPPQPRPRSPLPIQRPGRSRDRGRRPRASLHPAAGESKSAAAPRRQAAHRSHRSQPANRFRLARLRPARLRVLLRPQALRFRRLRRSAAPDRIDRR